MSASAVVGYALVADSGTLIIVAAVVGAIITAVGGIVQAVLTNSSANRRQRRELQYRGVRKSSMAGPLFVAAIALVVVAIYVATRTKDDPSVATDPPTPTITVAGAVPATAPTVLATALSIESTAPSVPIGLDEASALVTSYLESATSEETEAQAWAMFTENHQHDFKGGIDDFSGFWRNVASITPQEPSTLVSTSATGAELAVHLMYNLFQPNKFGVDCTVETDTFTLIRLNGALLIDAYRANGVDCPKAPPGTSSG
jgi:hypothetical protein